LREVVRPSDVRWISRAEYELNCKWQRPQDLPRKNRMPRAPIRTLTSWSFSRLLLWEQCPRQAMYKFLDRETKKLFETAEAELTPSHPLAKGKLWHKIAEDFVNNRDKDAKCPEELYCFEDEFAAVRKIPRARRGTEVDWAFDREWKPCAGDDWDHCWLRFRADLTWDAPLVRNVVDFKTGAFHDYNEDQARLGALLALLIPPFRKTSKSNLWYLEQGKEQPCVLMATQIEAEKKYWEARVAPMFADKDFLPIPEFRRCKYCPVSRTNAKGTLCPHG